MIPKMLKLLMIFLIVSLVSASGERKIACSTKCIVSDLQPDAEKAEGGNDASPTDYQLTLLPGSVMLQY